MARISMAAMPDPDRPLPEVLGAAGTAVIDDSGLASGVIGSPIRPVSARSEFTGRALPVRAGSLAQWAALEVAGPGDVIVIESVDAGQAQFGAVFVGIAQARGVAAIVTDGPIRDASEISRLQIPVFANGCHPRSRFDPTAGRVGHPIHLGPTCIRPGDFLVGDADGIAVLAPDTPDLVARLADQIAKEQAFQQAARLTPGRIPEGIAAEVREIRGRGDTP